MDKDIKKYDYLSVSVKAKKEEEMISRYGVFGWELFERKDDKRYSDIVLLSFMRLHNIPNKDRLQFLQVNMEMNYNFLGRSKQSKHLVSLIGGAFGYSIGIGLIIAGILTAILQSASVAVSIGAILSVCGAVLIVVLSFMITANVKKENLKYIRREIVLTEEIDRICVEAKKLGATYGA